MCPGAAVTGHRLGMYGSSRGGCMLGMGGCCSRFSRAVGMREVVLTGDRFCVVAVFLGSRSLSQKCALLSAELGDVQTPMTTIPNITGDSHHAVNGEDTHVAVRLLP